LGWKGDLGALAEFLGSGSDIDGLTEFRNTMAALRFGSRADRLELDSADERLFPCLFVSSDDEPLCVFSRNENGYFAYDGLSGKFVVLHTPRGRGQLVSFSPLADDADSILASRSDWLRLVGARFKSHFATALGFSFALGAFSLLYPLFISSLYGQMSIRGNGAAVMKLGLGVGLFMLAESGFRYLRSSLLGYASLRSGKIIGEELFRRLLAFQSSFTESASIEAQVRRMKDLRNVADFIAGQALSAIFDLPFIVFMLVWLINVGGALAAVPVAALAVFLLASVIAYPLMKRIQSLSAASRTARMDAANTIIECAEDIVSTGMRDAWQRKFDLTSANAAAFSFSEVSAAAAVSVVSGFFVAAGGLATLYVGVLAVLAGALKPAALVAAMMLVWRVLGVARSTFIVLNQIDSLASSLRQLERFMVLPQETRPIAFTVPQSLPDGDLQFKDVSFRYGAEGYPALYSVSFVASAGSITVLSGRQGAGKTTVLKLALSLYRAQAGRVMIGPFNIQQMEPTVLRRAVAYAAEKPALLPGCLKNFFAGAEESFAEAAARIGLEDALAAEGLSYDSEMQAIAARDSGDIERLAVLCRAFTRRASIYLFDEQLFRNAERYRTLFAAEIKRLAGSGAVVLVVSNDQALLDIADRIVHLDAGRVTAIDNRKEK
jgi:ATP-binding cassette subfamily C protein/ATP-binding cassette subfamily C protein LapB